MSDNSAENRNARDRLFMALISAIRNTGQDSGNGNSSRYESLSQRDDATTDNNLDVESGLPLPAVAEQPRTPSTSAITDGMREQLLGLRQSLSNGGGFIRSPDVEDHTTENANSTEASGAAGQITSGNSSRSTVQDGLRQSFWIVATVSPLLLLLGIFLVNNFLEVMFILFSIANFVRIGQGLPGCLAEPSGPSFYITVSRLLISLLFQMFAIGTLFPQALASTSGIFHVPWLSSSSWSHVAWVVAINDIFVRSLANSVKILLLVGFAPRVKSLRLSLMMSSLEYLLWTWRIIAPVACWCAVLSGQEVKESHGEGLEISVPYMNFAVAFYIGFKISMLALVGKPLLLSLRRVFSKRLSQVGVQVDVSNLPEGAECTICRCEYEQPVQLACNHTFCEKCISQWLLRRNTCPVCRRLTESDAGSLLYTQGETGILPIFI